MRISDMNWMMVEEYLKRDDRCGRFRSGVP